jgi:hypothetical protein
MAALQKFFLAMVFNYVKFGMHFIRNIFGMSAVTNMAANRKYEVVHRIENLYKSCEFFAKVK